MLPFNLNTRVLTFSISVGLGASLGRQFNPDTIMSGLLDVNAFLLLSATYSDGNVTLLYLSRTVTFPVSINSASAPYY